MPTLSISQFREGARQRQSQMDQFFSQQGFIRMPNGSYTRNPTFQTPIEQTKDITGLQKQQLDIQKLQEELDPEAKQLKIRRETEASLDQPLTTEDLLKFNVPAGTLKREVIGRKPMSTGEIDLKSQMSSIRQIVNQIGRYSSQVNTTNDIARQNLKNIGALLQTDTSATMLKNQAGVLSLIIRALGEKGTLAEGDVRRGEKLIPKVGDTRKVARQKIQDLQDFITTIEKRGTEQTTSQPNSDPLNLFK